MSLVPDPEISGLWTNPAWQPGTPGTFAVVVGVSAYPHLDGGTAPAQDNGQAWIRETRSLHQLYVSALTAQRFFDWLEQTYHYPKAPLARCWLLVAPNPAETAFEPRLAENVQSPTLAACSEALKAWRAAMRALPALAQRQSRAFFFFSGHGLQVHHGRQLLLPTDYLGGVEPNWDEALATSNLVYGLASLELEDRLYFVDACRNDLRELRAKKPEGRTILSEDEAAASYGGARMNAILYATATALQAWQPTDPASGLSLYGQALLDGLAGRPDIELVKLNGTRAVALYKLQGYARSRVVELLAEHQSDKVQPILLGGEAIQDEIVTELLPPPAIAGPPPIARRRPPPRTAAVRAADLRRMLDEPLARHDVELTDQRALWHSDYQVGHNIFGSERITELWQRTLRLYALSSRTPLDLDVIELRRVDHDAARQAYRLELAIAHDDPVGFWLQAGRGDGGEDRHGVVLPADHAGELVYRLAADVLRIDSSTEWDRRLLRLDAWLAPSSVGLAGQAAELWRTYASADVGAAVGEFEAGALRGMVRQKLLSPLTATIAALVLLRANRLDLVADWLRNLADWFPDLPDGAVLWAEQVLRQEPDRAQAVRLATVSLVRLNERGLPFTAEGFSYAASLVERLRRTELMPDELRERFEMLAERIDQALVWFRPNGLFAAYAGFGPDGLDTFLPPPR